QGLMLVTHRTFFEWSGNRPRLRAVLDTVPGRAGRIGFTFVVFCLSLVVFRSPQGLAGAGGYYSRLFVPAADALGGPLPMFAFLTVALLVAAGHMLGQNRLWQRLLCRLPAGVQGVGYGVALSLILLLAPATGQIFIYFQF